MQKRIRRQQHLEVNSQEDSALRKRAIEIHPNGMQMLGILCATDAACFHSEDEDVQVPLGSAAAAAAASSRRRTAIPTLSRAHAFRSTLADKLLALLGRSAPSGDVHPVGIHRVSVKLARTLLARADLNLLIRVDALQKAAGKEAQALPGEQPGLDQEAASANSQDAEQNTRHLNVSTHRSMQHHTATGRHIQSTHTAHTAHTAHTHTHTPTHRD